MIILDGQPVLVVLHIEINRICRHGIFHSSEKGQPGNFSPSLSSQPNSTGNLGTCEIYCRYVYF